VWTSGAENLTLVGTSALDGGEEASSIASYLTAGKAPLVCME